jgi:uncharacterized membrane protein
MLKFIKSRPRLVASFFMGLLVFLLIPHWLALHAVTRLIIGWNVAAVLYLMLAIQMMMDTNHQKMRQRAREQDEGKFVVLSMVVIAAVIALAAIVLELGVVKELSGTIRYAHMALAVVTILSSWAFTQVMFALHYAHAFYGTIDKKQNGGLLFPDEPSPDYIDFLYFACVIGTSAQTADVSFSSQSMRKIGLIHSVLAFFFNTSLVALMINIASSLI